MCDGTYAVLYVGLMMQVQYAYLLFYVQFGPIVDFLIGWQKNVHSFRIHVKNQFDILLEC